MGEVSTSPEVAARVIEDLTALEVDTNKGERLYKAAVIRSTKWAIRRILEQKPERFDKEIEAIQKAIQDNGEEVAGLWVHDMTGMCDTATQGHSLEEFNRKTAAEVRS